ncbi:MAG: type II toxin-antitoxin system HicA family toxin [Gammaproteobacteria bacterium]|nr:type II toxin-antitoxin system HicA family toxin [Gammaproteobacteria bacterium]
MSRKEKLLKKALNNPSGLSFNDLQTLMDSCDWVQDHQTGSHQIWYSTTGYRLSIQNRKGKAKGYQVKQFLAQYCCEVEQDEL